MTVYYKMEPGGKILEDDDGNPVSIVRRGLKTDIPTHDDGTPIFIIGGENQQPDLKTNEVVDNTKSALEIVGGKVVLKIGKRKLTKKEIADQEAAALEEPAAILGRVEKAERNLAKMFAWAETAETPKNPAPALE